MEHLLQIEQAKNTVLFLDKIQQSILSSKEGNFLSTDTNFHLNGAGFDYGHFVSFS